IEHITGSLSKTIEFFGAMDSARLRIVTKFSNVDPLLGLKHNGHTRFRVSINSRYFMKNFKHNIASFDEIIEAASKLALAWHPIGFVVAPIMFTKAGKTNILNFLTSSGAGLILANCLNLLPLSSSSADSLRSRKNS
ncbi:MAG: spore photoproduct lyase, partial [Euryarchaeota archaeon]|nr:spore photoproduct lyase [Euryarchaeota archaeon]